LGNHNEVSPAEVGGQTLWDSFWHGLEFFLSAESPVLSQELIMNFQRVWEWQDDDSQKSSKPSLIFSVFFFLLAVQIIFGWEFSWGTLAKNRHTGIPSWECSYIVLILGNKGSAFPMSLGTEKYGDNNLGSQGVSLDH
jgi:hypothetical protein